ncbi:hypothetical protein CDD80_2667 [Ophiocordyceps camponoti-rufipedis]|uniref:Uncharacterized protein n=1 Tax=Ophiocordyceps camponoti-rufipedis TaxID=2004952 RepID=A0A2C5Z5I4_9HYPO|nr:hypothetical protein CDD80_2667 [Ophiocordyceps camponoti-rufipedis]
MLWHTLLVTLLWCIVHAAPMSSGIWDNELAASGSGETARAETAPKRKAYWDSSSEEEAIQSLMDKGVIKPSSSVYHSRYIDRDSEGTRRPKRPRITSLDRYPSQQGSSQLPPTKPFLPPANPWGKLRPQMRWNDAKKFSETERKILWKASHANTRFRDHPRRPLKLDLASMWNDASELQPMIPMKRKKRMDIRFSPNTPYMDSSSSSSASSSHSPLSTAWDQGTSTEQQSSSSNAEA